MLIAFVGDVHGRIFQAFAAVLELQARLNRKLDAIIQVGDLGYPDPARADASTKRYLAVDPAEGELERFLQIAGTDRDALTRLRARLGTPMLFVRGNHEDFEWLAGLAVDQAGRTAPADQFDLLHYVPDGSVLEIDGCRVAVLGGVEELDGPAGIDAGAYQTLIALATGALDVLVTHEGPYGSSRGYHGDVHGSQRISDLVEALQPAFHVFGHAHQLIGPAKSGRTTYLGLDGLVASPLWHPEARGLRPSCLALLDTTAGDLLPVTDAWLASFPTPFDVDRWLNGLMS